MIPQGHWSILTTCRDREQYLLKSLATWRALPVAEIVIVDWGSTRPLRDLLRGVDNRIVLVTVTGQTRYDWTKSRNLAATIAQGSAFFVLDCDIQVRPDKLPTVLDAHEYWRGGDPLPPPTTGTCLVPRTCFELIGGFSELFTFNCGCDTEFYLRLERAGIARHIFHSAVLQHQDHPGTGQGFRDPTFSAEKKRKIQRELAWGPGNKKAVLSYKVQRYG